MTDQTKKQNAGKSPVYQGCLSYFPRALKEVARVSEFGATKYDAPYTRQGWRGVAKEELMDAQARHILDRVIEGDVNEKDGGMLHLAQNAWEALAALEVFLVEREAKADHPFEDDVLLDIMEEMAYEEMACEEMACEERAYEETKDREYFSDCDTHNAPAEEPGECDCDEKEKTNED